MTVVTKLAIPKKAVRELKNLRTSTGDQRLKLAWCHRCHRCHGCHAVRPGHSK